MYLISLNLYIINFKCSLFSLPSFYLSLVFFPVMSLFTPPPQLQPPSMLLTAFYGEKEP